MQGWREAMIYQLLVSSLFVISSGAVRVISVVDDLSALSS